VLLAGCGQQMKLVFGDRKEVEEFKRKASSSRPVLGS
jgi:hypothetical protein